MEASWAVLERRKAEKARSPKSFRNLRKIDDFRLLGLSWAAPWRPPGASWRPLGPSWAHLRRLGPIFRRLVTFLGHHADPLGAARASQKRVCRNAAVSCGLLPSSAGVPRVAGALSRGVPPQTPPGGHTTGTPPQGRGMKPSRSWWGLVFFCQSGRSLVVPVAELSRWKGGQKHDEASWKPHRLFGGLLAASWGFLKTDLGEKHPISVAVPLCFAGEG